MRTFILCSLVLFLFSSCLVVKVYQTPDSESQENQPSKVVHRSMIRSGKTIDLGANGSHELLFFGEDKTPGKLFFTTKDTLIQSETIVSEKENMWVTKESKGGIKIITDQASQPLVVVDGQESSDLSILETLKSDAIESINVLKGAAAEKNYGEKGINGVIEITLKKE